MSPSLHSSCCFPSSIVFEFELLLDVRGAGRARVRLFHFCGRLEPRRKPTLEQSASPRCVSRDGCPVRISRIRRGCVTFFSRAGSIARMSSFVVLGHVRRRARRPRRDPPSPGVRSAGAEVLPIMRKELSQQLCFRQSRDVQGPHCTSLCLLVASPPAFIWALLHPLLRL